MVGQGKGHSVKVWMEFKRSEDGGKTWSDPEVLPYSKKLFDAGQSGKTSRKLSALAEKAILTDQAEIVLYFLVCEITTNVIYRQFQSPNHITSSDGGYIWSVPRKLCGDRGRVYDARYYNGEILVLNLKTDNDINFLGNKPEHVYELYVSRDGGKTFTKRSELPFDTLWKSYGTMTMLESGRLIVYINDCKAEEKMDYVVSDDGGCTWSDAMITAFKKRIRNPQMNSLNGCYFMHGQSSSFGKEEGMGHFFLYSSRDGINWDDGTCLLLRTAGLAHILTVLWWVL